MESLQRRNTYHREANRGRDDQHLNSDEQGTYSGLRSDIEQIKSQLRDMKQMMRISFDLQMDIQRAIRQEVAAAMVAACNLQTAHIQTVGFTPPPPPSSNSKSIVYRTFNILIHVTHFCSWCHHWAAYATDSIRTMHHLLTPSN